MIALRMRCIPSLFLLALPFAHLHAQVDTVRWAMPEGRHTIALYTGNSWVPEGRSPETGGRETVIAPTFGLDYEYRLSPQWAIGTYNDVEIMNIVIEKEDGTLLERENTMVFTVGGSLYLYERMKVELGAGVETDANATLKVGRIAYEYIIELPKRWEVAINANYLFKEVYDVVGVGVVFGKRLGR